VEQCWAATVHKSQGCEFPVVIMVAPWEHKRFLSRNLLYTGVTRAKTLCVVVGEDAVVSSAVGMANSLRRHTGLPKLLKHLVEHNLDRDEDPEPAEITGRHTGLTHVIKHYAESDLDISGPEPEDDYPLPPDP